MAKRAYRRNPLSLATSENLAVLAALAVGGYFLYRFLKDFMAKNAPKSNAEKKVDSLYGPSQQWRSNPVYNSPGSPNYIPGLPVSYPPGTPESEKPVPSGTYGSAPFVPAPPDATPVYGMESINDIIAANVRRIR